MAVVPFVQTPVPLHGNPEQVEFVERDRHAPGFVGAPAGDTPPPRERVPHLAVVGRGGQRVEHVVEGRVPDLVDGALDRGVESCTDTRVELCTDARVGHQTASGNGGRNSRYRAACLAAGVPASSGR